LRSTHIDISAGHGIAATRRPPPLPGMGATGRYAAAGQERFTQQCAPDHHPPSAVVGTEKGLALAAKTQDVLPVRMSSARISIIAADNSAAIAA
jgi:hypothetical protein